MEENKTTIENMLRQAADYFEGLRSDYSYMCKQNEKLKTEIEEMRDEIVAYRSDLLQATNWISIKDEMPPDINMQIIITDGELAQWAVASWLYRDAERGTIRCPAKYGAGMDVLYWLPCPPILPKEPECYKPNDNPYPLCVGNGSEECGKCCIYENMEEPPFED